ncbi:MAG TPA: gamma-glutamyl-gamma-aminobutyrate hydrolase family protein [Planctomycetota bacterium]|nr:gamma-glutamyl-gamma-aminobutyrate hydrolase family protein [Planctomycetota bacterium]
MTPSPRPLIAINGELTSDPSNPALRLPTRYGEAILNAGGIPVAIPPVGGPADVARLLERVDGLLLGGGDDFDTARLGLGPTHPQAKPVPPSKQEFDFALARAALASAVPVLGICYGMQLLALAEGGRLLQHLPEDRPEAREHRGGARHPVLVEPASKLGRALGVESLEVTSRHHQAVARVGAGWKVSAVDDQGLIEAIESERAPFAIGVQWHPEVAPEGGPEHRLFRALVAASGAAAQRRRAPRPMPLPVTQSGTQSGIAEDVR